MYPSLTLIAVTRCVLYQASSGDNTVGTARIAREAQGQTSMAGCCGSIYLPLPFPFSESAFKRCNPTHSPKRKESQLPSSPGQVKFQRSTISRMHAL
ncbi:hypothetical protein BDR03DRAFT_975354 [Suillus americanus]|nr:hypothetical protein BDR03DRAFT_975354 [Suillus americanus]